MNESPDPLLGRAARTRGGGTALLDARAGGSGDDGDLGGGGDGGGDEPVGRSGGRRSRRVLWLVTAAVVALGLVVVTVLPVRSYVQQRRAISSAQHDLTQLQADNQALQDRVTALGTDAELELLAREQLNLVYPGEEAFAMLPPQFPSNLPPLFPYPLARRVLESRA